MSPVPQIQPFIWRNKPLFLSALLGLAFLSVLFLSPSQATTLQTAPTIHDQVIRFLTFKKLQQGQNSKLASQKQTYQALYNYYGRKTNRPLWINKKGLNPHAIRFITHLEKVAQFGLSPRDFKVFPLKASAHSTTGKIDLLSHTELQLSKLLLKYARHAQGSRMLKAGLNHFFDMKPLFRASIDILNSAAQTQNIESFLTRLHPKNKQFSALKKLLSQTRLAFQKKPSARLEKKIIKIQMNMERWRLLPDDMANGTGIYVWTNIPELRTRIVANNQTIFTEKAIVGKVSKQTPVFMDKMEWIEFFPTWYIPNSIKRNDLLPRLRRGNTKTLEQFNLKVDCGKYGRNPKKINWKKVDIRKCSVTQPPAKTNVLGNFKFKFPNKHSVYMHDTDDRHLFKRKSRYMSHGCVRVQHPDKMAQLLLSHAYGAEAVNVHHILSGKRRMRKEIFAKPVPVYMTYFTMMIDDGGKLKTLKDPYGHDRRMAHLFTNKTNLFPAPRFTGYKRPKRKIKIAKHDWRKEAF